MGKILIANVGNRTLVKKGVNDTRIEYAKGSFKETTKSDWEDIESDADFLEILDSNIIDAIIKEEDTIDRIFLFTSDQTSKDEKIQRKDTIYAGKILSVLLKKKFSNLKSVEDIALTGVSAINLDELTTRFRKELLELVENKHKGEKFIICDSGGTPQQKNALKIVAEYFLDKDNVDFYQVYEDDEDENGVIGKSHAEIQKFHQIRTIADAQSISILINEGEYAASVHIGKDTQKQDTKNMLWLMHYRLLIRYEDAQKQIINNTSFKNWELYNRNFAKEYPSIFSYLKKEPTGTYSNWSTEFSKDGFFRLCEILEIGSFYYFKNDWSNVVLSYHVFLETFVALLSDCYGYCQPPDDRITSKIMCLEGKNLLQGSLDFINDFKRLNNFFTQSKSLNNLRNQVAHEGKGVKREEIEQVIPSFFQMIKTWHIRLSVPFEKDKNAFIVANKELQKKMQIA